MTTGKLKIAVLYDRWEPEEEEGSANGKAPLVRTLDKKEVEDEVTEALTKLGHETTLHQLDGSLKSLHALAKLDAAGEHGDLARRGEGDPAVELGIGLELAGKRRAHREAPARIAAAAFSVVSSYAQRCSRPWMT